MKILKFNSQEEFLKALDGKVYAISAKNGDFLCDILEEDLLKLLDERIIIDLSDFKYGFYSYSDYMILSDVDEDKFKELYGVDIEITEDKCT